MFQFISNNPSIVGVALIVVGIAVGAILGFVWWAAFCVLAGLSVIFFAAGQNIIGGILLVVALIVFVGALQFETEGIKKLVEPLK